MIEIFVFLSIWIVWAVLGFKNKSGAVIALGGGFIAGLLVILAYITLVPSKPINQEEIKTIEQSQEYIKKGHFIQNSPSPKEAIYSSDARFKPVTAVENPLEAKLSPQQIFKLVQPSIYMVFAAEDALLGSMPSVSQGSAVALSESKLATNCHVVNGRPHIVISKNGKMQAIKLLASDVSADACILEVVEGVVVPVKQHRILSNDDIGIRLFAVGSPRAQENTLSDGLLSGIRVDGDHSLLQITVPISPGSSGGGLFDDAGNLVGITSAQLRDSQSINFAVSIEYYFQTTNGDRPR